MVAGINLSEHTVKEGNIKAFKQNKDVQVYVNSKPPKRSDRDSLFSEEIPTTK